MIECISETRSRLCKMTTIFTFLQRKNQKIGRMITYPEYWLQKKEKKQQENCRVWKIQKTFMGYVHSKLFGFRDN